MAPVARVLAEQCGVLEPFQTQMTIDGQIEELRRAIADVNAAPAILIGHSWGAWLAYLLASRHPSHVSKLILVGSGGFRPEDGEETNRTRLSRLSPAQRAELERLQQELTAAEDDRKKALFARLGELLSQADGYDMLQHEREPIDADPDLFASIYAEAVTMRADGRLLDSGRGIRCSVLAIHGDYDPHPAAGVEGPLFGVIAHFRFVLLERCGHEPWYERHARDEFFRVLRAEIDQVRQTRAGR